MNAPTPRAPVSRLTIAELSARFNSRPAAIHVGAGLTVALSGELIVWRGFLQRGLEIALDQKLINADQFHRHSTALDSPDLEERVSVGSFIESKLRPRSRLFQEWLRSTVGDLQLRFPEIAAPLASASRRGILLSSNNYETLLTQATGIPHLSWRSFRSIDQLTSPPAILHTDGIWEQPESIVLSVRRDSQAAVHRDAIQDYLGALRFILFVGIGSGFFATDLAEALKARRGTLDAAILCREEDFGMFAEHLARDFHNVALAPFSGGFERLPAVLAELLGTVPIPAIPSLSSPTPPETPHRPTVKRVARVLTADAGGPPVGLEFVGESLQFVTALQNGAVSKWDISSTDGVAVASWSIANKSPLKSFALNPRAAIAAAGFADGSIHWLGVGGPVSAEDFAKGSPPPQGMASHQDPKRLETSSLAFSPDGQRLMAGTPTGHLFDFRPDSTSPDTFWKSVSPWKAKSQFTSPLKGIVRIAFDPSGLRLAALDAARVIHVLKPDDAKGIRALRCESGYGACLAFSPDGSTIACAEIHGHVVLRRPDSDEIVWRSAGHTSDITSLRFHPSGQLLASGSQDTSIRLWSVSRGYELTRLDGHRTGVNALAFSADGQWLVSASSNGTIRIWPIDDATYSEAPSRKQSPLPEEFLDLTRTPNRLATFLGRLPLRHREALPLLETLEPGRLSDVLTAASIASNLTPQEFAGRVLELERALDSDFAPPDLWLAWLQHVRASELTRLGQELVAIANRMSASVPKS